MSPFLFLLTIACSQDKSTPYTPPENIKVLVAGDTVKVWKLAKRYNGPTRMNMGDCFLSYRQTFYASGKVADNNEANKDCGLSLEGRWSIINDEKGYTYIRIESSKIPDLFGISENLKNFRIFYASKDSLHVSFLHNQYGSQRRISDYLVRETIEVPDRGFHH